jgi:streptomycin 6-kinase
MDDRFVTHALRHGERGRRWLRRIPAIVAACEMRWSLRVGAPFPLSYAYVAPATRADGTEVVLKINDPEDDEFWTGVDALRVFNGDGVGRLIAVDRENAAILLERVTPGVPLSTITDDEAATRVIAGVIKRIAKPLPAEHSFITIPRWFAAIPQFRQSLSGNERPVPPHLLERAETLVAGLSATAGETVLVHGDLHHDNVLSSDREGWLAIDPKGVAAERAYETAAMLRNPYDRLAREADLRGVLRRRIVILAEELSIDPRRIRHWGIAQTVLSAVWSAESGSTKAVQRAVAVAEALNTIEV